jgi:hypothetical protein
LFFDYFFISGWPRTPKRNQEEVTGEDTKKERLVAETEQALS